MPGADRASTSTRTAVVLVGVRVDLSEPFSYPECLGSTEVIRFSFEAEDGSKNKDF